MRAQSDILAVLSKQDKHFRKTGRVVFLCGGKNSRARDWLRDALRKGAQECMVFYAESAWEVIAYQDRGDNALEVERTLAGLADIVIVIVESPGTFAELGAFALVDELRKKLLPILDQKHRGGNGFVETGPVRWVDGDSDFRPSIWCRLDRVLEVTDQVEERLARIRPKTSRRERDVGRSEKHVFLFLCDLVSIFSPCTSEEISKMASHMFDIKGIDVELLLALGVALGLLQKKSLNGFAYFGRSQEDGSWVPFSRPVSFLDVPALRARAVSAMQAVPEGLKLMMGWRHGVA